MDYTDFYNFQSSKGIIVPSDSDVLEGVQNKFKEIFGSDLDVSSTTPVGRLIEAVSQIVKTTLGVNAQSANQFNLDYATGNYLDSIAQIFSITRTPNTFTQIPITVWTSSQDATVPAGSLVTNTNGDLYSIDEDIKPNTEDGNLWKGTGTATATSPGPVSGDYETVNKIATSVYGLQKVLNQGDAIKIGTYVETDEAFRSRIKLCRASGGGFREHLLSRLNKIDGISDVCVLENNNSVEKVDKMVLIPGHSIYVCIYSPSTQEIHELVADAIVEVKPIGVGMVDDGDFPSSVEKVEIERFSKLDDITKTKVTFFQAGIDSISVKISVSSRLYTGTDLEGDIKSAIRTSVGNIGIGVDINSLEIARDVMNSVPSLYVTSISLTNGDGTEVDVSTLTGRGYLKPIISDSNILITQVS